MYSPDAEAITSADWAAGKQIVENLSEALASRGTWVDEWRPEYSSLRIQRLSTAQRTQAQAARGCRELIGWAVAIDSVAHNMPEALQFVGGDLIAVTCRPAPPEAGAVSGLAAWWTGYIAGDTEEMTRLRHASNPKGKENAEGDGLPRLGKFPAGLVISIPASRGSSWAMEDASPHEQSPVLILGPHGWPVGHCTASVADKLMRSRQLMPLDGWTGVQQLNASCISTALSKEQANPLEEAEAMPLAEATTCRSVAFADQNDKILPRLGRKWGDTTAAAHHRAAAWRSISAICADVCQRGWLDGVNTDGIDSALAASPSYHSRNAPIDPIGHAIEALAIQSGDVVLEIPALCGPGHCAVRLDRKLRTVGSGSGGTVEAAAMAVAAAEAEAARLRAKLDTLKQGGPGALAEAAQTAAKLTSVFLTLDELCDDGAGSGKVWIAVDDMESAQQALGNAVEWSAEFDARASAATAQAALRQNAVDAFEAAEAELMKIISIASTSVSEAKQWEYYDIQTADRHRAARLAEATAEQEKQVQEVEAERLAYAKARRRLDRQLAAAVGDAKEHFQMVLWDAEAAIADEISAALVEKLVNQTSASEVARNMERAAERECKTQHEIADNRYFEAVTAITERQELDVMVINRRLDHALNFEAAQQLKQEVIAVQNAAAQALTEAANTLQVSHDNALRRRKASCAAAWKAARFAELEAEEQFRLREIPLQNQVDAAAAAARAASLAMIEQAEARSNELCPDAKWVDRLRAAEVRGAAAVQEAELHWVADRDLATQNKLERFRKAATTVLSACKASDAIATQAAKDADSACAKIAQDLEASMSEICQTARRQAMEDSTVLELAHWSSGVLPFSEDSIDKLLLPNSIYFLPSLDNTMQEIRRVLRPGGRLVCLTKLGAVEKAVQAGRLSPELVHGERELIALVMEAGFGKPEVTRFRLKVNHQAESASCTAAASQVRTDFQAQVRLRLAARCAQFPRGWNHAQWSEEISTTLQQCCSCDEYIPPSTELTWRPIFLGRVQRNAQEIGKRLCLCADCHRLLTATTAEEAQLERQAMREAELLAVSQAAQRAQITTGADLGADHGADYELLIFGPPTGRHATARELDKTARLAENFMREEDIVVAAEIPHKVKAAEEAAARAGFEQEDIEHTQAMRRQQTGGKAWDAADLLIAAILQG
eukprot:SAG31_NODE_169_length_21415_cov_29.765338_11_plen_1180_part_00